ncbi:MAG: ADP-heptose:LPS heptosyltransferase [Gammaproteobacteria bacterium]|jgi:ADP-heptose:LPS heptosyltransferase
MNVLIIKLGALGDVVMATSLISAIQQAHPTAELSLLTSAPFAALFRDWPGLTIRTTERRGLGNTVATIRWIRSLECDRIYDLQGSDRSAILCALSACRERVGNHPRYPYSLHPRTRWQGQSHIYERMIEVLAAAGVTVVDSLPILPAGPCERDSVNQWLTNNSLTDDRFVVLHAGASATRPEKRWPFFAALGSRLDAVGLRPVWIGAAADSKINRELCAASGGIDASDCFNIVELAELGRHARFAVTNDSGPMHVLSASQIPVFGLFGPSDWRRNHALGQESFVIAGVECIERYRGARSADCLAEISCDMIWMKLNASGVV